MELTEVGQPRAATDNEDSAAEVGAGEWVGQE